MKMKIEVTKEMVDQLGRLARMDGVRIEEAAAAALERALSSDVYGEELQLAGMKETALELAGRIDRYREGRSLRVQLVDSE